MTKRLLFAITFAAAATLEAQPYRLDRCVAGGNTKAVAVIAAPDERGARLVVTGRVVDATTGAPVPDVFVRAFQADATGRYSHETTSPVRPRICGVVKTGADGRYTFETIRPASYPATREPAHIHFQVFSPALDIQSLLLQFSDDPFVRRKADGSRTSVVRPVEKRNGRAVCERDLAVRLR